jgi:drug/metabolite transporter (DMT)-like permease
MYLLLRLVRRPIWVAGLASMILGFALQVSALHFGPLALVQPILAVELIFVFGYIAVTGARVKLRDWLAALAMCAGLGLFLLAASPSGGRPHAPAQLWLLAGLACLAAVTAALIADFALGRHSAGASTHRAAALGAASGISWGFLAAVIKEFGTHLQAGVGAVTSTWSLYVLAGAGAATLLLASHALAAGPLAASQPGFTILDPLSATLLGLFLFDERIQTSALHLAGVVLGLVLLIAGVTALSHSHLIAEQDQPPRATASPTPKQDSPAACSG